MPGISNQYRYKIGANVIVTFETNADRFNDHSLVGNFMTISGSGPMYMDGTIIDMDGGGSYQSWLVNVYMPNTPQIPGTLDIPDGITSIAPGIFSWMGYRTGYIVSVDTVNIGADVEEIGDAAFEAYAYGINELENPSDNTLANLPDAWGVIGNINILGHKIRKIGNLCFAYQTRLTILNFKHSVEEIGWDSCFAGCWRLQILNLADDWVFSEQNYGGVIERYGYMAFWKCKSLATISLNNTINCIDHIPNSVGYNGDNYYGTESLSSITIRNPVDSNYNNVYPGDMFVRLWEGTDLDPDGYFITELETPFAYLFNVQAWKDASNRLIVSKFGLYVYHMGRIIKIREHADGNIPIVKHLGAWKYIKAVEDHENPDYSPLHFKHKGKWYQILY